MSLHVQDGNTGEAEIWAAVRARLAGYVGRRVAPSARDDVVGDILERLVRHRDQLTAAERPFAWMYRVAANVITDHHRRGAAERRALDAAGRDPALTAPAAGAAEAEAAAELADCLVPFMRALPDRDREALQLIDLDGLSQAEAARRLGLTLPAMKSRVQRARARLRAAVLRCCAVGLDRRGQVMSVEPRRDRAVPDVPTGSACCC